MFTFVSPNSLRFHCDVPGEPSLHTGEVQGSIPCASTRKAHDIRAFRTLQNSHSAVRQNETETCVQQLRKNCGLCSCCVSALIRFMSPRIIHIPLSGGDRKAQPKGIRYAHGINARSNLSGFNILVEKGVGSSGSARTDAAPICGYRGRSSRDSHDRGEYRRDGAAFAPECLPRLT